MEERVLGAAEVGIRNKGIGAVTIVGVPAGEDVVLMVSGVILAMLAIPFGADGFWGKVLALALMLAGLGLNVMLQT